MLSTDDLRFFLTISKATSLAEVARQLDVTPPAVSQRLNLLEARLNVRLVNRSTRSFALTTEGEFLARRCSRVIEEVEDIVDTLAARKGLVTGKLRVVAPFGFGRHFVAPVAAEFKQLHPEATIELHLTDDPMQRASGSWDVAIHIGELKDSTMLMIKLAPNDRVLCASPEFASGAGRLTRPQDLRALPALVIRENDEDVTLWRLSNDADAVESLRVDAALASNDGEIVRDWALKGLGVALRSEWSVADDLRAGRLVRLLPQWRAPSADIVALFASRHGRTARSVRFVELLRARLSPPPWRQGP